MISDDKRLKEIKKRRYEIAVEFKQLKKELVQLSQEESMITGYYKIEKSKKAYKSRKKVK